MVPLCVQRHREYIMVLGLVQHGIFTKSEIPVETRLFLRLFI